MNIANNVYSQLREIWPELPANGVRSFHIDGYTGEVVTLTLQLIAPEGVLNVFRAYELTEGRKL